MAKVSIYINFTTAPSYKQLDRVANKVGFHTTKEGNHKAVLTIKGKQVQTSATLAKAVVANVMQNLDKSLRSGKRPVQGFKSLAYSVR